MKISISYFLVVTILFLTSGCAFIPVTPESYTRKLKIDRDSNGAIEIGTPFIVASHQPFTFTEYSVSIKFNPNKTFSRLFVYIVEDAEVWRYYDDVMVAGKPINSVGNLAGEVKREIARGSSRLVCQEHVAFSVIDENIVKDALKSGSGIPYRLSGKVGFRNDVIPHTILEAIRISASTNGITL
jgi:hypothetical protein